MTNKILRTPTRAEGGVTDEEKEKFKAIVDKYTKIAFRTDHIDKDKITDAIKRLYAVSGLDEPIVVIAPSPFVARLSSGIAASVWYLRDNEQNSLEFNATLVATRAATRAATYNATYAATHAATVAATYDATDAATVAATHDATYNATLVATRAATAAATDDATYDATYDATDAATYDATYDATDAATYDATDAATYDATEAATFDATRAATDTATYNATYAATFDATHDATYAATDTATYTATVAAIRAATHDATHAATRAATDTATREATDTEKYWLSKIIKKYTPGKSEFTLDCIKQSWKFNQGGNMWSYFLAYAEAMRDVIGLKSLDCWDKYQAWEDAGINGGHRYMHKKFCIVSDFPEILEVNDQNQPHSIKGPSHRWRDGFEIYHLNGVKFDKEMWTKVTQDPEDGGLPNNERAAYILKIEDVDQRTQAMRFLPPQDLIKALKGEQLDEVCKLAADGTETYYRLIKFPKGDVFTTDAYYMYFNCPSTHKEHIEGVHKSETVAEAMALREEITEDEWLRKVPLTHET